MWRRKCLYPRTLSELTSGSALTEKCTGPSYVDRAAREAGSAVAGAAKKMAQWAALAERLGAEVVPLAMETTGRRGSALETFMRKMAAASSFGSGARLDSLWVQLSVTMVKFNVAMVREALRFATGVRALRARRGLHGVPSDRAPAA